MEHISPEDMRELASREWSGEWNAERSSREVESLLLEERVDEERPAVLFSGGVDSALVAAALMQLGKNPELYVFAEEGSSDRDASEIFAEKG